jgi:tetratricopeptide (TPR) repeat protein
MKRSSTKVGKYRGAIIHLLCCLAPFGSLPAHGDLHETIARISRQIENDPDDVFLYFERGLLYKKHGDLQLALADYERVLSLEGGFHAANLQLAQIYLQQRRPAAALRQANAYLETNPQNPFAYETRAAALQLLNQFEAAAADLHKMIALKNEDAIRPADYFLLAKGILQAFPGDYRAAITALEEGLARLGPLVSLQSRIIDLELEGQNYAAALEKTDLLLAMMPNNEHWINKRTEILEKWGCTNDARQVPQRSAEWSLPKEPPISRKSLPGREERSDHQIVPIFHSAAASVVRGPYLQLGTPNSMVIKWRTNMPTDSRVWYGPNPSNLDRMVVLEGARTEHEVKIANLTSNTRYYYAIGNEAGYLAGGSAEYVFQTSPRPGSVQPVRAWILGDCGTKDENARAVRDGYYTYAGANRTDLILLLGDNAYEDGTDEEYQLALFENMYEDQLIQSVLWPTPGNHDYASADAQEQTGPYYDIFTLPKRGEAGGLASGTEAYYSFDYANIHFISLDSHDSGREPGDPMLVWLENDLSATNQDWIVVFFHHPPYSKGSHDSDTESILIEMRENVLPILEAKGVDLVLTGHSHSYERSFLIEGHYGHSSTLEPDMIIDDGDGRMDGQGAYQKYRNAIDKGQVYVTSGSAGKVDEGSFGHPVMFYSAPTLGSVSLEVTDRQLDLKFIGVQGEVIDYFSIQKESIVGAPPSVSLVSPIEEAFIPIPQTIALEATAADPDGHIQQVAFFVNDQSVGTDVAAPYQVEWQIPSAGVYGIQAVATDNDGNDIRSYLNRVNAGYISTCAQIAAEADDAEERSDGVVNISSSDLEMVFERSSGNQIIGLRFTGLEIPHGAVIQKAYIQFMSEDDNNENPCVLNIYGQAADAPAIFSESDFNLSSRPRTESSVGWSPEDWSAIGEDAHRQRTPDLSAVMQEIVNRPGYTASSALAFIIDGTGRRTAESFDGLQFAAPELCVEYAPPCSLPALLIVDEATSVCSGQESVFHAGPAYGYRWNTGDTTATVSIRLNGPAQLALTAWDRHGCLARESRFLTVHAQPEITFDYQREEGLLSGLSTGDPVDYAFQWNTGETAPAIPVNDPGSYCLTLTDSQGCSTHDCIELTITAADVAPRPVPWKAYPNPFERDLIIGPVKHGNELDISVFDLLGQAVAFNSRLEGQYITLSFDRLPDGLYLIVVKDGDTIDLIKAIKHS